MAKILVADDTAFMRMMIKKILELHGMEIIGEAKNGEEAVIMYKLLKPDIVTMDITMPEKNGLEALKEIKQFDKNAKIIIVSALGQESMVQEAILNGAVNFIIKPFKEENVINAINKLI